MATDELIEVKFRLADGTDIGPSKYSSITTVGSLKEKVISQWPKDKENGPKTINDMKLINAGKILENNKTLAESRSPVSEIGGIITMLVVVRPPMAEKNSGRLPEKEQLFLHNPLKFIRRSQTTFQDFSD
ncbi:hypothetical protein M8C21_003437 [Ambrosia artemisiifolia]|uniref:Ubiquitin-like domain-containing protein n=1 Tax=Ambrosia artemisiifolia TaxID=4212 RepID=A0AAD5G4W4_AMBAR|nr:hypothetical protein M8C21_003437 [Ambrosia artemisiifolia]